MDMKKRGRLNRQQGASWESKVKKDLIERNWFVSKFQGNVDFNFEHKSTPEFKKKIWKDFLSGKEIPYKLILVSAKPSNRFRRGTLGFPDFICWKIISPNDYNYFKNEPLFDVIGIEAKSNGYLDKTERAKCKWLLDNKIFSSILIAKKKKAGRRVIVEYVDFKEK